MDQPCQRKASITRSHNTPSLGQTNQIYSISTSHVEKKKKRKNIKSSA